MTDQFKAVLCNTESDITHSEYNVNDTTQNTNIMKDQTKINATDSLSEATVSSVISHKVQNPTNVEQMTVNTNHKIFRHDDSLLIPDLSETEKNIMTSTMAT